MLLCENKELIDSSIYNSIVELKDKLMQSVTTLLFFHSKFKGQKSLEKEMKIVLDLVEERILDIQLYLQTFS